ncbi:MAG: hypothetical protein N3C61_00170 [Candidatus Micrarchaeota archaeon]|nr:hypothetical protein [Candidatus Micrarchaeota archaeon]
MKAQVATEYFLMLGVMLLISLPIIALFFSEYNALFRDTSRQSSVNWLMEFDNDIKSIKYQGNGSYMIKRYTYPIHLESIETRTQGQGSMMIVNISDYGTVAFIYPYRVMVSGTKWRGPLILNITNSNGEIRISKLN